LKLVPVMRTHLTVPVTQPDTNAVTDPRPTYASARKAMGKFVVWADTFWPPWRMLGTQHEHAYTLYYTVFCTLG